VCAGRRADMIGGMNPVMAPIRKLIAATTLGNPRSLFQAVRRGAFNGWRWANFFAVLPAGFFVLVLVAALIFAAYMRGVAGLVAVFNDKPLSQPLLRAVGALLGCYVAICGWGVVIGAILGGVVYSRRRPHA
jgi:hypothetical protein